MDNLRYADVVITGGGASGLAAAIELKMTSPELSVVILEKNAETGRKIRATGSGRCNISNRDAVGYTEIMVFFERIGLVTRTYDNGLVYPYSESAADAADLLAARAESLGVRIITGAEVTSASAAADNALSPEGYAQGFERFETTYELKNASGRTSCSIRSACLILACGGKAGPMFGTTGDGYRLARGFGHSIVTPVPVLTPVDCSEWTEGAEPAGITLAGTRTRGTVTLYRKEAEEEAELFRETGEIQFTKTGLSGICVFNMTRHMRYDRSAGEGMDVFTVRADLFPDGNIEDYLKERRRRAFPGERTSDVLRTVLKENIAAYVIEAAGCSIGRKSFGSIHVSDLSDREIASIGDAVHRLAFHPAGIRGWKEAQATSGGVSLGEIDPDTCESALMPGLFITGELADRDFMCGGFNLSNAWLTGIHAAQTISSEIIDLR